MTDGDRPGLLIDIDGVLAEYIKPMIDASWWATGGRVQLRPEDIVEYDFRACADAAGNRLTSEEWAETLHRFHHARPKEQTPLALADPVPGAVEAVRGLANFFDIAVVTSRADVGECRVATVNWVGRHLAGIPHSLHFVRPGRKHLVGGIAAAVEDDYEQAAAFARAGIPCCLLERPYNAECDRRPRLMNLRWCADWPAAANYVGRVLIDQLKYAWSDLRLTSTSEREWRRLYQQEWPAAGVAAIDEEVA